MLSQMKQKMFCQFGLQGSEIKYPLPLKSRNLTLKPSDLYIHSPVQLEYGSPSYPGLHEQLYEPGKFMHIAFSEQLFIRLPAS